MVIKMNKTKLSMPPPNQLFQSSNTRPATLLPSLSSFSDFLSEKMPDQRPASCCQCCASFIFTLGLTSLFMWLSLRPKQPTFSIHKFSVPALNKSANNPTNTTITFDFTLTNPNKDSRIYYDNLNITIYYAHNLTFPIGNVTIPGYRQGRKKEATKSQNFTAVGVPWKTALEEVSTTKTTVFRVDLETMVRYKTLFVMSKRKEMKVGGNVSVNDEGIMKMRKKGQGVKLSSGSVCFPGCVWIGFLVFFVWVFV